MDNLNSKVEVVIFEEKGQWMAQSVSYDIASFGETPEQAVESFMRIWAAEVTQVKRHLASLPPAQPLYVQMWNESNLKFTRAVNRWSDGWNFSFRIPKS